MYGYDLDDLSIYEIDEYMLNNKPTDEELYDFVLQKIEDEVEA